MEKCCKTRFFKSFDDLQNHHELTKAELVIKFEKSPTMKVPEQDKKSSKELKEKIEEKYDFYATEAVKNAAEDRQSAFKQAYKQYKEEMEKCCEIRSFESFDDMQNHHKLTKEELLTQFEESLTMKIPEQDRESSKELKEKIEEKYDLYATEAVVSIF
eukprot:XP_011428307.1 PREDICTED: uncharacterized protein LOC105328934 [Crassostrea gigas]